LKDGASDMNARATLSKGRAVKKCGGKVCMYFCAHLYNNILPAAMNSQSRPILFAIAHPELIYFQNIMNDVFAKLNTFF
jgi:hypothetical protein